MKSTDNITKIPGIGPKKAEALQKLGIRTVEDMYLHFPRDYEDRRELTSVADMKEGKKLLVRAKVLSIKSVGYSRRGTTVSLLLEDRTGTFEAVFFNAPYIKNSVFKGKSYDFYGNATLQNGRKMIHPRFQPSSDDNRGIIPVYPLTKGISNNEMIKFQKSIMENLEDMDDYLTEDIRKRNNLCDLRYALENVHFPTERNLLAEGKYRIVFDEMLIMQLGILMLRSGRSHSGSVIFSQNVDEGKYIDSMPYELTNAQRRAVDEIISDMESDHSMNRLLQGDVGSGKTAIAEIAMYKACESGYQAALMAPTEILARQHYEHISKAFKPFGIKACFLGGKMKQSEKNTCIEGIKNGDIKIIIGTHAVISKDVEFSNLGLVITDEQHRFGVNQRTLLGKKGENPNKLLMTATPIPRTLAVVIYGDLDISVIDELPKGRLPVITKAFDEKSRNKAYDVLKRELSEGRQGYVVTPLIEENKELGLKSVFEVYDELKKKYKDYRVEMLHGEMKTSEKDEIMEQFRQNKINLLVSTVVIEVGINVPNATVMIIENAERFGLAQLHQLRGRVGRGKHRSYCMLISAKSTETSAKRAEIMETSNDGFYIAEEDLKLRGPGEIFGTRQHGLPDFKMADMVKHINVLKKAGKEAVRLEQSNDYYESDEYEALRRRVKAFFGDDITLNI